VKDGWRERGGPGQESLRPREEFALSNQEPKHARAEDLIDRSTTSRNACESRGEPRSAICNRLH
jgi:hypothetical protein